MIANKIAFAKHLLASDISPKNVTVNLGVSISSLYRWIPAFTEDLYKLKEYYFPNLVTASTIPSIIGK